jgi:hypothetical protein
LDVRAVSLDLRVAATDLVKLRERAGEDDILA